MLFFDDFDPRPAAGGQWGRSRRFLAAVAALLAGLAVVTTLRAATGSTSSSSSSFSFASSPARSVGSGSSSMGSYGASAGGGSGGTYGGSTGFSSSSKPLEAAFSNRPSLKKPDFFSSSSRPGKAPPGTPPGKQPATISTRSLGDLLRTRLVARLDECVGAPVRPGGRELASGVDATGLVCAVFEAVHRKVPDDPQAQTQLGLRLSAEQFVDRGSFPDPPRMRPGDILFFRIFSRRDNAEVLRPVIYYGDGKGVIASTSRGQVLLEDIRAHARRLAFVQRVLP